MGLSLAVLAACSGTSKQDISALAGLGEYVPLTPIPMTENEYRANNIEVARSEERLTISAGYVMVDYDLNTGTANVYRKNEAVPVLSGMFAETEINDQRIASNSLRLSSGSVYLEELDDPFGKGVRISVKNQGDDLNIWQNFYAYETKAYMLFETVVEAPAGVITNYIAPIAAGTGSTDNVLTLKDAEDPRFLFVPFDNDGFIRYRSDRLIYASESYEVTSVFDNVSRKGLVTGSVTHDTWKTGIRVITGIGRGVVVPVVNFRVFGGITSGTTRDVPANTGVLSHHGSLVGHQVYSPKIFFGLFDDWRDGMEEYGRAVGIVSPPLAWDHGPPFGWNSWNAVGDKLDYSVYVTASDFLKNELPNFVNHNGVVYINFDSFWDNLTVEQRKAAADHVRANGHRPGIYHTPFTVWHDNEEALRAWGPEGSDYKWSDLVLKDQNGRPMRYMRGAGYALDPTHPGTVALNNYRLQQFKDWGFEYVKLDFLSHGAMEGQFNDRNIRTGKQAYNYGMQKMIDFLEEDIESQSFFISLSIAPIFPSQYAYGRRISCDVFGTINWAEYMLNSLTYGWWLNGSVYPYNDPDHIAVYNGYNHLDAILFNEGLTRYISSAIAGTFMIDSDDFRIPEAKERARQILTNAEVNRMAGSGKSFRPVEGNTGEQASDIFVRHDTEEGVAYLALFNFSDGKEKTMTVSLERIGLDAGKTWRVRNLVLQRDEVPVAAGFMTVHFEPAEPKLFKFY